MNGRTPLAITLATSLLSACSPVQDTGELGSTKGPSAEQSPPADGTEDRGPPWDQVSASIALQSISESFSESFDVLGDTSIDPSTSSLGLRNVSTPESSCRTEGDKAIVTSLLQLNREWQRQNENYSSLVRSSGELEIVRTWSKPGGAVLCAQSRAGILLESNLSGYLLDLTIDRIAQHTIEKRSLTTGQIETHQLDVKVQGERSAQWLSQVTQSDGSMTHERQIRMAVKRSSSYTNPAGAPTHLALDMTTSISAPLKVTNTWSTEGVKRTLVNQLIESGTINAEQGNGKRLELNFDKLRLDFSTNTCKPVSGDIRAQYYLPGVQGPSRIYRMSIVDGEVELEDVTDPTNPIKIENFNYVPCNARSFQIP
jgi:hypothetical protein